MSLRGNRQLGPAVFLIGLGIIAFFDYWWPGIMFVSGAALLALEYSEAGTINWRSNRAIGGAVAIIIGLFGLIDFDINWDALWPIALIAAGAIMLLGRGRR